MVEEKPIEIKEENREVSKPMDETEWICEHCNITNFIIYDDITTSRCCNPDCFRTNMNILEILNAYKD